MTRTRRKSTLINTGLCKLLFPTDHGELRGIRCDKFSTYYILYDESYLLTNERL